MDEPGERSATLGDQAGPPPAEESAPPPTREELQAELLELPPPTPGTAPSETPGLEQILSRALQHVRGKRGGDLLAVLLVGSGARRDLTPHSDLDLIALVKSRDEGQEWIRVADRLIEIRYRWYKAVEDELPYLLRLPPLLRKARILFDHDQIASKLVERANQCFRQGPPHLTLNERIRLKADCLHWIGKAEDLLAQPATCQYLLARYFDDLVEAYFRIRGWWPTSPADLLRFITSRDQPLGAVLERFLTAPTLAERLEVGRQLITMVFQEIPNPPRVD